MSGQNFIDQYGNANPEKRIDMILDYYKKFPSIIEGQKKILILKIKNDREYLRQNKNKDTGVPFVSNDISDPTACEAIENVHVEETVFRGGDISELIYDMEGEDKKTYRRQFSWMRKPNMSLQIREARASISP